MDADVVVVGAGPTGLMLAGDLAEAGVAVTVLERRADESNVTRAFAVHARTMEELEIRVWPQSWPRPARRSGRCACSTGCSRPVEVAQ